MAPRQRVNLMLSTELLSHYRHLSQQPLTVVDVETTGHRPHNSRVMELSVLQARVGQGILQQQTSLINPNSPIPENIVRFTGITPEMVADAPPASEVLLAYQPLLSTGILTAHNLPFDYGFLKAEYDRCAAPFQRSEAEQLCTVELARLMLADLPSRSLPDLVQHFQFPVGRSHRAAADAQACWYLAERLLTDLNTEPDAVLLERFARQWIPLRLAAKLVGKTQAQTRHALESANIPSRQSRSGSLMYRRGDVEQQVLESRATDDTQLSLWG